MCNGNCVCGQEQNLDQTASRGAAIPLSTENDDESYQVELDELGVELVAGVMAQERNRILKRVRDQVCFDALADEDGRCENHGGKCYELLQLIKAEEQ